MCTLSILGLITTSSAEDYGPSEWTQYRLNPENNPVYKGSLQKPLKGIIKTNDEVRSTPVVVGNNVFIGNHNTGDVYSYNLINEKMNWQNKAPNWIHSEIIHFNNQLFVGFGNRFFQKDGTRGTGKSGLMSLDPSTGDILWTFETKGEVMPTPAIYDNTAYITTGDKHLYAIDPESGKEKWRLELNHVVSMSSPNIKDGILYVGAGRPSPYTFFAIDLTKKEVLWKTEFQDVYAGLDDVPPAIFNKLVFTTAIESSGVKSSLKDEYDAHGVKGAYKQAIKIVIGGFINKPALELPKHMIYAMDTESGNVVWKDSLGTGQMVPNNKSGAPIIYEDKVFVGSPITKTFYSYDARTGKQLWSYKNDVNKAPPVADKGKVYFTNTKGFILAFNTEDGSLAGSKHLGGTLAPAGPIIINDSIIVGSQDSNVYMVPINEVLNSKDSLETVSKKSNGFLKYIVFIYLVPAFLLVLIAISLVLVYRKKIEN